eukprot:COSAG05_NODE_302_length_11841_cov_253.738801_1_plen_171_part_00
MQGLFVMLYKGKGKIDDRSKYRCICLLNHAYKLLSAALLRRLVLDCDGWLPESQAGFRKARGCPDNIVALAALFDDTLGRADEAVLVFIDFVATFVAWARVEDLVDGCHRDGGEKLCLAVYAFLIFHIALALSGITTSYKSKPLRIGLAWVASLLKHGGGEHKNEVIETD